MVAINWQLAFSNERKKGIKYNMCKAETIFHLIEESGKTIFNKQMFW